MVQPQHSQPDEGGGDARSGIALLQGLREAVLKAVGEIARLRAENRALRKQLEERPSVSRPDTNQLLVTLDEDPAAFRRTLDAYIEALDRCIDAHP